MKIINLILYSKNVYYDKMKEIQENYLNNIKK